MPYLQQPMKWPSLMRQTDPYIEEMNDAFSRLLGEFERKDAGYELLVKAELANFRALF